MNKEESTVKLVHVGKFNTGGLCVKVKIDSKVTLGTQPSSLYRWSLDIIIQVVCKTGFTGLDPEIL